MNIPRTVGELGSIDIKSKDFFWLLQPWKEGKLATMDGWAQFSELDFEGEKKIKITPLAEFPKWQIDRVFQVWEEANLFYTRSAKMVHIADLETGFTKSFIPYLSFLHNEPNPVLLDPKEGLIIFVYIAMQRGDHTCHNVIYNYKEDKVVYESEPETDITMQCALDPEHIISTTSSEVNGKSVIDIYIYNWKTGEKIRNELTEKLTALQLFNILSFPNRGMSLKKRYLLVKSEVMSSLIKITWDEKFENVEVIPLGHLIPEGKYATNFLLSTDGEWAVGLIGVYEGLYGEYLYKRAFFHIDERYPGGVSMPVFAEGYEEYTWDYGSFVEHPVYGMCYAKEHYIEKQLYLRLYRISDALDEIKRSLLNTAEGMIKK